MGLAMIFRWSYSNNSIMKNVILSLLFFAFSLSGVAQNGNIIIPSGHDGAVRIIMIDNQSKYFYTADEWKVIMWDFNTAKQLYTFPISNKATTQHFGSEVHNLRDLIVSADGKTLAFTTSEDELVIYSTESGKKINSIHGVVSRINFSKDGKTIYDFVRGPEGGDVQPGTNGRMIRTINVQSGAIIDYWHKKDMNIWGSFIQYFFPIEAGKVINFDNQGYTVLDLDEKKEIIKSNVHEQLKDNYKIDTEGFNRHYFQVAFGSGLFSFQTHKVKGSLGFLVWDVYDNKEFAFLPLDKNYKVHDSYVKGRFLFANKSSRYDKQEAGILEQGNKIAKKVNITGSNEIKVAALSKNGNTIIYCGEDQKLYKYDLEKPIQNPLPAVAANVALASVTRKNDDLIFNSISRKYDKGETINFESENVNYIVDLMRMAVKTADTLPIKQAKSLYTVRLNKDSFLLAYSNPNDERFMYNVRTRKTVSFQNKSLPITLNSTWRSFPKIPAIFAAKGSGNFFITEDGTDNKGRDIAGLVKYNLNTKQSTRIFSTGYFQGDEWEQRVNDMNNRARVENALVMDQENNLLASAEFYYKGTVRVMDLNTGKTLGQRSFVYDSAAYAKGNTTGASGIIQEGIQNYPYYITQVKKINDHTARVLAMEKIFEIDLNGGAGKEIQIIQPQYFSQKRNIKLFANNKMETVISTYQTGNRLVAETIYGPYQYKLTHLASPINSIEFSKNDSILYTVNENKSFSAYNAITGFYYGTLYTFENPSDEVLSMAEVIEVLNELTKGDAVIVTDVGQHQMVASRYAKFIKTRSTVTSGGLGTMGFGLPAAIGAKYGAPDRTVVAIIGDGGFQMTLQELGTIMQFGAEVKILILNNEFLGMVRQWQQLFLDKRYSFVNITSPDFVALAKAYYIEGQKVSERDKLRDAVKTMLDHKGSYLLEVMVGKENNVFPMVPQGCSVAEIRLK